MLGIPNMSMEVEMSTMSKLANPMRMQLMEFFIWGLQNDSDISDKHKQIGVQDVSEYTVPKWIWISAPRLSTVGADATVYKCPFFIAVHLLYIMYRKFNEREYTFWKNVVLLL